MNYTDFLEKKQVKLLDSGFIIKDKEINFKLFDFQKDIVKLAIKKGKFAIFADCGLGKSFMQLEWARIIQEKENKPILILAPLAVSKQTKREGKKLDIEVNICTCQEDVKNGINITNYEKMHKFNLDSFVGIVLDESSILKSYSGTYRNEIIDKCKNIKYKLACTATPAPNDYMELGNHSEFLDILKRVEMLSMFFVHDAGETQTWRLKGHAESKFWEWISEWAVMIRKPSDLGYDDGKFNLPELKIIQHIVECNKPMEGDLFVMEARTLDERRKARRNSLYERVEEAKKIIGNSKESWIIWCNLNTEGDEANKIIKDSFQVSGSDGDEYKENTMNDFAMGNIKILISKALICGFGMNFQICHNVIFLGLSDSYEQYYQAVRRCWRFGQKETVNCHIIISNAEGSVLDNIRRKEQDTIRMAENMTKNMKGFTMENLNKKKHKEIKKDFLTVKDERFTLYNGDCIEVTKQLEDNSIDYSLFSPPFAELYTYSDKLQDMGNSKNYDEFFLHFDFLVKELHRVLKQGRLISIHCIDIPAMKERDGYIGLKDFPGDIIRLFQRNGFIYHSRCVIWKNPLIEATRTKALGLMHKQLCKDSAICRQGLPDYVITMRKKGENKSPITHGEGFQEFIGESIPTEQGIKFSHEVWRRYASPVWTDINQSNTLQKTSAREEKDEKHICPLQLDVIARCIDLWSNKDEIILSPFAGIGSEIYQALKMGRKGIGIELKESYFNQAVANCNIAKEQNKELF